MPHLRRVHGCLTHNKRHNLFFFLKIVVFILARYGAYETKCFALNHIQCTIGKISDYQPEGPEFSARSGRGLNFGRPSFATPSVDRDVKPLV